MPIEEKMQTVAIDDPTWIKLYLLLYKAELKQRDKDPKSPPYSVKKEKIRYMYNKLCRREARGVTLLAVASGGMAQEQEEESEAPWEEGAEAKGGEVEAEEEAEEVERGSAHDPDLWAEQLRHHALGDQLPVRA